MNNEYIKQYYKEHSLNKNKIPDSIIEYLNTQFINKFDIDIIDKLLCILNDTDDVPRCSICGKPCKRDGYTYHKSCGNSKCIYGLRKQSMIKKIWCCKSISIRKCQRKDKEKQTLNDMGQIILQNHRKYGIKLKQRIQRNMVLNM